MTSVAQSAVRAAIAVDSPELHEAVVKALDRNGAFELVGSAINVTELAGVVHTELPDVLIVDALLGGGDIETTLARVCAGRPYKALVLVEDERTEKRQNARGSNSVVSLAKPSLLARGLAAKTHVARYFNELAELDSGMRRTIPTDILIESVERRQSLAGKAGVRDDVAVLGTWPLDLIILVGGRGNESLLTDLISRVTLLPVPVLLALRPGAALDRRAWTGLRVPMRYLTSPLSLRLAEGFLVTPTSGSVRLSPDAIKAAPGHDPLEVADLVRSSGALQSGALTVQLSDESTDAAEALAGAVDAGAAGAVLDPRACAEQAGPQAALAWGQRLTVLSPSELLWLLVNAAPRRT